MSHIILLPPSLSSLHAFSQWLLQVDASERSEAERTAEHMSSQVIFRSIDWRDSLAQIAGVVLVNPVGLRPHARLKPVALNRATLCHPFTLTMEFLLSGFLTCLLFFNDKP